MMKNKSLFGCLAALGAASVFASVEVPFDWRLTADGVVCRPEDQKAEIDDYASWTHRVTYRELSSGGTSVPVRVFFEFEGRRGVYLKCTGWVENVGTKRLAVDLEGPVVAPWKVVRGESKLYYPNADGSRIRRFPTPEEVAATEAGKTLGQVWEVGADGLARYRNRYDCSYPARGMMMQYVALSDGKSTWSYAVKDPLFSPKQPSTTFDPKKDELDFHFTHRMALAPGERRALPRIEVLKRAGDWQVAALDYGAWFKSAVRRAPTPDWLRDSPSFPLVICKQQNGKVIWPFTEFDKLADALEAYGANQVQILGRGPGGHDNRYPDYTPDPAMGGEEALVKGLKVLRDRGIRTYAYVNGQLIEKDRTDWWRDGGSTAGVMKPDGTRYGESWWKYKNRGEKAHSFDVACPCSPLWKKRMREIALDAVRYGFDGLYVDQMGKQRPMFCCDASHDHPAGEWVFAQDRVRLMEDLRTACTAKNPDFVLETEGYCEPMASSCSINLGLGYPLNGIGRRFLADEWADHWPEMTFLTDPDYISSDRYASPTRTRHEVNAAAALGYRLDFEVRYATDRVLLETCGHTDYTEYTDEVVDPPWDFSPPFDRADFPKRDLKAERAYIKATNLFRLRHRDLLLRGRFMDELGFSVKTDAKSHTAKRWVSADGLWNGVLVWNADSEPRTFAVSGCGVLTAVDEPEKGTVDAASPLAGESIRLYLFDVGAENVSVVGPEWRFTRQDDARASADGTFVSTACLAADGTARLSVVEQVRGDDRTRKPNDLEMTWKVLDETGRELDIDFVETAVSDGVANGTIEVRDPVLWSPESPRLVTLVSELRRKGDLVDRRETRFGIRTVRVTPEGLLVNGKAVEIRGAGLHADLGSIGPAFNASAFRRQLRLLRDMGCNAIRTAHNPPAPDAMAIADEEGFLVMAEAFDMWKSAKVKNGYWMDFPKWGERDFTDFIALYRNHPSIVLWSIGNEIWESDVRDTVDLPCLNYRVGWDPNEARFLPQVWRLKPSCRTAFATRASTSFPTRRGRRVHEARRFCNCLI